MRITLDFRNPAGGRHCWSNKRNIPEMACSSPFGVVILLHIAWSKLLSTLSCLTLACFTWRVLVVQKTNFSVGEMCMICPPGTSFLFGSTSPAAPQMGYCSLDVVSVIPTSGALRNPTMSIMEDEGSARRLPNMYNHPITETPLFSLQRPQVALLQAQCAPPTWREF